MDIVAREEKKIRDAMRLRDVPPERTLAMAFELVRATRALNKAAEHADA